MPMFDVSLFEAMALAGWEYDLDSAVFCKDEMFVTVEQAQRALGLAQAGIVVPVAANDDDAS